MYLKNLFEQGKNQNDCPKYITDRYMLAEFRITYSIICD